MKLHMLTTVDNPFDPFTRFDEWFAYDTAIGHHTSSYLARVVKSSYELSETDQDLAMEYAIDEIVRENPLGIYIKVSQESGPSTSDAVDTEEVQTVVDS